MIAARRLRDALQALDGVWFPEHPDDLTVLESIFLEGQGLNRLHMLTMPTNVAVALDVLTHPVKPALKPTVKDHSQQVWVSATLLGSLATMAVLDRVGGPPRCKWCGTPLVPGKSIGVYCSEKCREAGKIGAAATCERQAGSRDSA